MSSLEHLWPSGGNPTEGLIVKVELDDGTIQFAYWDGEIWIKGVDDSSEDIPLSGLVICWCHCDGCGAEE